MKKMYHLATCTTCQGIIKETKLDEMKKMAGSYEALFSRRAMKYKELGLKDQQLTEKDYRKYILEEYTFLKRPVTIVRDKIFIGNEKKVVEGLKAIL
jgi:arsenate reductase